MRFARIAPLTALVLQGAMVAFTQAPPPTSKGMGDLMIAPTRVVLEGRTRAGEVMLKNAGIGTVTYRIFLQEMEMAPDGQLQVRAKAPGELTASDVIRFSPRQVELAPGESQIVRIQARKPENLPDGEYRSHMVFQGVPPAEAPASTDPEKTKQGLAISIKPIYGISIPVILRHGETTATLGLDKLVHYPAPTDKHLPVLSMELRRQGNRSVMGDIEVAVLSGGSLKKGTIVGTNKGVAIYSNLASRTVVMPLTPEKGATLKGCTLKVTFTAKDMKAEPVSATLSIP